MTFIPLWPETHVAKLKEYVETGFSFSQMAKLINEEFGSVYSRNACIGKAGRLGLGGRKFQVKRIASTGKAVIAARNISRRKPNPPKKFESLPPLPFTAREADAEPKHIAFEQLSAGLCKWPFGRALPFTFCGCATYSTERSYCPAHHGIGHVTVTERQASKIADKEAA